LERGFQTSYSSLRSKAFFNSFIGEIIVFNNAQLVFTHPWLLIVFKKDVSSILSLKVYPKFSFTISELHSQKTESNFVTGNKHIKKLKKEKGGK
jgi:hypothetical protein